MKGNAIINMAYDRMGRRVTKNDQRFVYNGYLQIANFRCSPSYQHQIVRLYKKWGIDFNKMTVQRNGERDTRVEKLVDSLQGCLSEAERK